MVNAFLQHVLMVITRTLLLHTVLAVNLLAVHVHQRVFVPHVLMGIN